MHVRILYCEDVYACGDEAADQRVPKLRLRRKNRGQSGFTLIELLIVIAVLGVIAAVVVFALGGVRAQSAVAACNANAKSVETAVAAYNAETGGTPPATADLLTEGPTPYLRSFPSSPDYSISIVGGEVMVAIPVGATPVAYDTANPCGNAGTSGETSTTTTPPPSTTTTSSPAATSTTVPATTTTTTTVNPDPDNGVTVAAGETSIDSVDQDVLTLTNSSSISVLSITIGVATTGVTNKSQGNTFASGTLQQSSKTSGGVTTYTSTLKAKKSVPAGSTETVFVQFKDSGGLHQSSGDTWSVTSTSDGLTSTIVGTFG